MNNIDSNTGEIVMYQPDETIRLEVRMGEETVWLSQAQMAELLQRDQSVIARHIRNIYKEEELDEEGTYAKFAYMGHKLDIERHNQQYPPITVNFCHRNHDRFLIIDDVVYLFGASLKDAGKKLFAYIKMQETPAVELLNNIQ